MPTRAAGSVRRSPTDFARPSERRAASHRWSRCYLEAPSRRPLSAITQAPVLIAGTSVDWDFEAPPWAVIGCARCASKTGDGRATSGCLREGYHTVWVVGEAIAEVEQQYEVVRTQSLSETVSYLRVGHV